MSVSVSELFCPVRKIQVYHTKTTKHILIARSHDKVTARSHDKVTARSHDKITAKSHDKITNYLQFLFPTSWKRKRLGSRLVVFQ